MKTRDFLVTATIDRTHAKIPVRVEAKNTTEAIYKALKEYYIDHGYDVINVECYEMLIDEIPVIYD